MRKATAGNPNVHILVSPWVQHVKVGLPASAMEKYRVIRFCAEMLKEASKVKWLKEAQPHEPLMKAGLGSATQASR